MFKGREEKKPDLKIIILQRGWAVVGRPTQTEAQIKITDCSVIRIWGTEGGIGELAIKGPREKTKLDYCGAIECHELTTVFILDCEQEAWANYVC